MSNLLNESELATQLNLSPLTLRDWRSEGRGPRYLKFPGKKKGTAFTVRYRQADVDNWLASAAEATKPSAPAKRKRQQRGAA